jgi:hypothetical protein
MGSSNDTRSGRPRGLGPAFRRGIVQGNRVWTAIFLGRLVVHGLSALAKRGSGPVVRSEVLQTGESLIIRHLPANSQSADKA